MSNGRTIHPGSIFGALLLIAIGALFLYSNLEPDFSPWPWVAKYWPVLIIFWGLAKLVNYLALRGRPEAAAAARISGGDIFGLILLVLCGSLFSQVVDRGWWSAPGLVVGGEELGCLLGREYEFSDELAVAVEPPATFRVRNLRGDVNISRAAAPPEAGPPEARSIRVVARKKVCAPTEAEASRLAESFQPLLEEVDQGYEFRWEFEGTSSRALSAHLAVEVPARVSVQLSNRRGDVEVKGVQGSVALDLQRGEARMEEIRGNVSVELGRGSAHLAGITGNVLVEGRGNEITLRDIQGSATLNGEYYGPLHLARITGPTRFESSQTEFSVPRVDGEVSFVSDNLIVRGVPGEVTVRTRSKEIEMEEVAGSIDIKNRNGPVLLRFRTPPANDIRVETRSGDIELFLPEDSGFQLTARARDGEIESDFRGPGLARREERRDQTMTGTYGTRRASITLSTTYGTIYLRHALAAGPSD